MNNLFTELRRRNIFRVAGVYAVVGWILAQAAGVLENSIGLPTWFDGFVVSLLLIGFPIAMLLAWAFEMTPEGMKRTEAVVDGDSVTAKTGRGLDYVIVGGLVLVGALVVWQGMRPVSAPFLRQAQDEGGGNTSNTAPHPELVEGSEGAMRDGNEATINPASIAVLPFADLSPEGNQEYFSDGMAEEILNVLVRVEGLKVASRTSAFGFKGQEALGIPLIAAKLNVRHILEGSVRKSGNMVRITAQLIDASTDQHLWSETYDRTLSAENIFAIQDEIAKEIVAQLGIVMNGGAPATMVKADTQNLSAYELYLQAHNKFIARSDIKNTIALFEQAVAADPGFARALAGLAAAYTVAPGWRVRDRDYLTLSAQTARKAIAMNPNLALAYAVLGNVELNKTPPDFTETFKQLDEAIRRDPKETTAWLWRGITNTLVGYFDKAEQDFLACLEIDPAYENCRRYLAGSKLFRGQLDEALALYEQGKIKGNRAVDETFMYAYAARGDRSTVLDYVYFQNQSAEFLPMIEIDYRTYVDPDFNFETERAMIEALYAKANGKPLDWQSEGGQSLALLYHNYAAIKNPENNLSYLWNPYMPALQASPHRKRIMREIGLPAFWRQNGFPPQCKPVGENDFECD